MIAIIDYGSGNIAAIENLLRKNRIESQVTIDPRLIEKADKLILPGVGSFDATMRLLHDTGMFDVLNEQVIEKKKNILGICVGMQIMAEKSDEGQLDGFGWIPGTVKKIPINNDSKPSLPHMGWNSISHNNDEIFQKINSSLGFYFLHSYYFDVKDKSHAIASTNYYKDLTCTVKNKNIIGTQFHPEKSHSNGAQIFKNFVSLT
tara:strand:+ start:1070 stop:1681 length:612 start_codon:yes stop_codon:yes gene_type:complete